MMSRYFRGQYMCSWVLIHLYIIEMMNPTICETFGEAKQLSLIKLCIVITNFVYIHTITLALNLHVVFSLASIGD